MIASPTTSSSSRSSSCSWAATRPRRNVGCGGLEALLVHPEQWARLHADPAAVPTAVEEMLRWVTPIQYMARRVVADTELAGRRLAAGDTVLMLYEAANFDEAQFAEPDRFAIDRSPNDHVAFGFGAHHCLGASLARLELRVLFERVLARLPDLALVGDTPPRTIIGISSMPVRFTPTAPGPSLPSTGLRNQVRP